MKVSSDLQILVVDDSQEAVNIMKVLLKKKGFEKVISCADGESAWIWLNRLELDLTPVELILVDWNMPRMKGIDLLKKMRAEKKYQNIPFVMVTADGDPENVKLAIDEGVNNYLLKPLTAEKLFSKIEETFKRIKK